MSNLQFFQGLQQNPQILTWCQTSITVTPSNPNSASKTGNIRRYLHHVSLLERKCLTQGSQYFLHCLALAIFGQAGLNQNDGALALHALLLSEWWKPEIILRTSRPRAEELTDKMHTPLWMMEARNHLAHFPAQSGRTHRQNAYSSLNDGSQKSSCALPGPERKNSQTKCIPHRSGNALGDRSGKQNPLIDPHNQHWTSDSPHLTTSLSNGCQTAGAILLKATRVSIIESSKDSSNWFEQNLHLSDCWVEKRGSQVHSDSWLSKAHRAQTYSSCKSIEQLLKVKNQKVYFMFTHLRVCVMTFYTKKMYHPPAEPATPAVPARWGSRSPPHWPRLPWTVRRHRGCLGLEANHGPTDNQNSPSKWLNMLNSLIKIYDQHIYQLLSLNIYVCLCRKKIALPFFTTRSPSDPWRKFLWWWSSSLSSDSCQCETSKMRLVSWLLHDFSILSFMTSSWSLAPLFRNLVAIC